MINVFSVAKSIASNHWKTLLIVTGVLLFAGYIQNLRSEVNSLQQEVLTAELRTDSIEARADTTREIKIALEDSLRYFERRAVQAEIAVDSLDEQLNQESRVRADVEAQVDSLRSVVQSDSTTEEDGTRRLHFDFYQEPYTVRAEVLSPPTPEPGDMDISITMDPIPLGVRIGCRESNTSIQEATVGVTTPSWAQVNLENVQQTPNVCNPQIEEQRERGWIDRNRGKIGFIVGVLGTVGLGFAF